MKDSISQQRILDLNPYGGIRDIFTSFIEECENTFDITLRIMLPVFRSINEQNKLYEQGRSTPGAIVTDAKGGSSFHNYGLAVDICNLVHGKPDWSFDMSTLVQIATKHKLEWGGCWVHRKDPPHFEYRMNFKENCSDLALLPRDADGYPILENNV